MAIDSDLRHEPVLQLDQKHSEYTFLAPYFYKAGYESVVSDVETIFGEEPARRLLGRKRSQKGSIKHFQNDGTDTHPAYDFEIKNSTWSLRADLGDINQPGQLAVWATLSFYESSMTDRVPFDIDFVDADPDGATSRALSDLASDPDQTKFTSYMGLKPKDPLTIRGHALSGSGIPFTARNVSKLPLPDFLASLASEYRNLRPDAVDLGFTALVGVRVDLRDFKDVWESAASANKPIEGAQLLLDSGIFQS